MLEVRSLAAGYGPIQVLWDISLAVRPGEIVTVLGSNGAGKTTTMKSIAGILRPSAGAVAFLGRRIEALAPSAIVGAGLVLVPEGRQIWSDLPVRDNLELGAFAPRARAELARSLEWVHSLFPILAERARQIAGGLSGGQQQMLAIARGLMAHPKLLLLDEPSLGLAPRVAEEVFQALLRINEEGIGILLVEQDVELALSVADRAYILEHGRMAGEGEPETLLATDAIRAAYLGL